MLDLNLERQELGYPIHIPDRKLVRKGPRYVPHIYTDDELARFFAAVDANSGNQAHECSYRSIVLPVFFRILYTSGLRVSELRLARVKDMDLKNCLLTVRQAKNRKDRLVPIHPKLALRCQGILESIHVVPQPDDFFFLVRPATPLSLHNVYRNFRRYLKKAGIAHTGKGPRVHDFRHTFCVNLLRKWTAEGKDLMAWMPYMRTVLGHETFRETAYYLRLTRQMFPEMEEKLAKKFPHMFKEIDNNDEPEFY